MFNERDTTLSSEIVKSKERKARDLFVTVDGVLHKLQDAVEKRVSESVWLLFFVKMVESFGKKRYNKLLDNQQNNKYLFIFR